MRTPKVGLVRLLVIFQLMFFVCHSNSWAHLASFCDLILQWSAFAFKIHKYIQPYLASDQLWCQVKLSFFKSQLFHAAMKFQKAPFVINWWEETKMHNCCIVPSLSKICPTSPGPCNEEVQSSPNKAFWKLTVFLLKTAWKLTVTGNFSKD